MSSLEKLSIRGIRSFSPGRDEVIEFYHPLTVIVGANGCGKTTVIECLKCSCTGSLPPGARAGQSFVHDPKISGGTEVKGCIRLRFRNRGGQPMVVQRSFQLQQLRTTSRFKALDGVIRMINSHGEKVSMSHKCGELDKHIPELMGVSKAILENVIFVHQEDSNWPLQEGAVLKKKFDDIFESARYTKALEAIRKLKKEQNNTAKDHKRDLDVSKVKLQQAQEMQEKIQTAEKKIAEDEREVNRLEAEITQAESHVEELTQQLREVEKQKNDLDALLIEEKRQGEAIQAAYSQIEQLMNDSDEELQNLVDNYDVIVGEHQQKLTQLKEEQCLLLEQKHDTQTSFSKMCVVQGTLQAALDQQQVAIKERDQFLRSLSLKYASLGCLQGATFGDQKEKSSMSDSDVELFDRNFQNILMKQREKVKECQQLHRKKEDEFSTKISELQAKLHHIVEDLKSKQEELSSIQSEKRLIGQKIAKLGPGSSGDGKEMMVLEKRLQSSRERLRQHKLKYNFLAKKEELKKKNKEMNDANFELSHLEDQLKLLRLHERDHVALEHKRQELISTQEKLSNQLSLSCPSTSDELQQKYCTQEEVMSVLKRAPTFNELENEVNEVEGIVRQRNQDLALAEESKRKKETIVRETEASIKHLKKELDKAYNENSLLEKKQVHEVRNMVQQIIFSSEPLSNSKLISEATNALSQVEAQYMEAKEKTVRRRNTLTFLATYAKKGAKDHCCPLCVRDFSSEEEQRFLETIRSKTSDTKIQEKIKKAQVQEESLFESWKKLEKLLTSNNGWLKWVNLNEVVIPQKNQMIQQQCEQLQVQQEELEAILNKSNEKKTLLKVAEKVAQTMAIFNQTKQSICQQKLCIQDEEDRLASIQVEHLGANPPSLQEVETLKNSKSMEINDLSREIQRLQSDLTNQQEFQSSLTNQCHQEETQISQLREKQREFTNLTGRSTEFHQREVNLQEQIRELNGCKPQLQQQIRTITQETRVSYRQSQQQSQLALGNELQEMETQSHQLNQWRSKINQMTAVDQQEELSRISQKLQQVKSDENALTQKLAKLGPELRTAEGNLAQQESFKRALRDNINYRMLQSQLSTIREKLAAAKRSNQPSLTSLQREAHLAQQALHAARDERATMKGKHTQLKEQIYELQVALRGGDFRRIEAKHRTKMINYETTVMAVSDLDKYHKALDQALLDYHSNKIVEINTIIKELWQITYKGQDIDTIHIESGTDAATAAKAADTSKSRSYNYRVMMRKGDAVLEMRGRCSAGQKVLASLVIRLALAETFCLNCGILALDEPTTNLDTENKIGLAQAMTEIINARASQQNFQLICITHDEDFVRILGNAQMMGGSNPAYYWRISREELAPHQFYSKIERQDWDEQ